jgi:signal peptidase I
LFVIDVMRVEGYSMEPTLSPKQIVFVNRAYYGLIIPFSNRYILMWRRPQTGDIVVFRLHGARKTLIKRCMGVEGDRLIYENGYLSVGTSREPIPVIPSSEILKQQRIPVGKLLVVGDNLDNSIDSRSLGFIPADTVLGRVMHPEGRTHP